MKILADENIPYVKELFSQYAEIITSDGRAITTEKLNGVDVLLVRSVTHVDGKLLQGADVKFVGTATIGTDHLDLHYLEDNNIAYINAPGCNSIAVAEYILSGLFVIAETSNIDLRKTKVGVVGAGNVGTAVSERLEVMGIPYCLYDPPLSEKGDERELGTLEDLKDCKFISFHVPLTHQEDSHWPTNLMVNSDFLNSLPKLKYLLNTSRGNVVDTQSIKAWLDESAEHQCILDVWQNEPNIDIELLNKTFLATPHIAGHSREGKTRGTLMLFHAFCKHFEIEDSLEDDEYLLQDLPKDMIQLQHGQSFMQALASAVWKVYDIRHDDKALRAGLKKDIVKHFDRLRKGYKIRREFTAYRLDEKTLPDGSRRTLLNLGFKKSD